MYSINQLKSKISIRFLVIFLATIATLACVVLGGTSIYTNHLISHGQADLAKISTIQESSARISDAITLLQKRASFILASKNLPHLNALQNRSISVQRYRQSSLKLDNLLGSDPALKEVLGDLDRYFENFLVVDEAIYQKARQLIINKNSRSQLADTIDIQLNEIDSLIGAIAGKIRFSDSRGKRRLKRVLKKLKKNEGLPESGAINGLVKMVEQSVLGKDAALLQTTNNIHSHVLYLSAFARQLISATQMDTVLNLRQNKIEQHASNIGTLLGAFASMVADKEKIKTLLVDLDKKLKAFLSTSVYSDQSIYNIQVKIIRLTNEQIELLAAAATDAAKLTQTVANLSEAILATREKIGQESLSRTENSRILVLTITMSVIVILIAISVFIVVSITKPLKSVATALREIAQGDGDLTKRLSTRGVKEAASIAVEFNSFVEKIANLVRQVNKATQNLCASSNALSQESEATRSNIQTQQGETSQASIAIAEMSKAAIDIAANAEKARQSSIEAYQESETSNKIVTAVALSINDLATDIEASSHSISELEQFSTSIEKVLDVIRSVSEQTNLLALNAAIEAARAGSHGRGFAVVADEVRSLASRTRDSTHEIEEMVHQLQNCSSKAVDNIEAGNAGAIKVVDQVNLATASISKITTEIQLISEMNTSMASSAEEQSAFSQEIDSNVEAIKEIGNRTVEGTNGISQSGNDLSSISDELKLLMTQFRV